MIEAQCAAMRPGDILLCTKAIRYVRAGDRKRVLSAAWKRRSEQAWQFMDMDHCETQDDAAQEAMVAIIRDDSTQGAGLVRVWTPNERLVRRFTLPASFRMVTPTEIYRLSSMQPLLEEVGKALKARLEARKIPLVRKRKAKRTRSLRRAIPPYYGTGIKHTISNPHTEREPCSV